MALRQYFLVFSLLLLLTLCNAFNMKYVMDRFNAIETKFDAENQRRLSEMEALTRKFETENQLRRSKTDALERKFETENDLRRSEKDALERKFETENHLIRSEKDILEKKFETENKLRRSEKDSLEKKFETENQQRRSETDALERKFETESQRRRSETDALERKFESENKLRRFEVLELFRKISQLTGEEMLNKTEDVLPGENSTPIQLLTTVSPSLDKYKSSQLVPDHQNLHSYVILGAKLEKQENVKIRTALTSIGKKLENDYAIFKSSIMNEIRNFTYDITKKQSLVVNEAIQSLSSFKSDVEASILKLSNSLHKVNQTSVQSMERCRSLTEQTATALSKMIEETRLYLTLFQSDVETYVQKLSNELHTVNQTAMENVERCNNISDSFTIVTNERLNNFSAFVTTTQSELRNESGQSLVSLKSDVETSIQKLSNDLRTVNQTAMKNVERFNNVIDSLTVVTTERFKNLSDFATTAQSELRNETRQSLISLKSDVETSIKELSNDFQTVNVTAFKSVEHCNNVSESLAIMTNERLNNLSFVTLAQSELRNESRQSLYSLRSDVEASIQKLSKDVYTVNLTVVKSVEHYNNVIDSLTIVTNERLNNLSAFVTTTQSGLRNESKLSLILLKSDVETSIQKHSNDFQTMNQTAMKNVEQCHNVSDSLTIVTNERLNNISAFVTIAQSELRNELRQSLISLKSDLKMSIQKLFKEFHTMNQTAMKNVESFNNIIDSLSNVTIERLANLSAFVATRQSLILLQSDVETSIEKLSNDIHTVNVTAVENVERCNNVSDSLTIVTNERLNNLSAFVTTTQTELRNETRKSQIVLKSDVETSLKKLSNDFHTVNVTATKSVEHCNNVSDSLTTITNERFNNISAFVTTTQSELRNESRLAQISLKSDVETSIQKLSNDVQRVNRTAMENVERFNNVIDSLANVTNERFKNLSAFVTKAQTELRNESKQSLVSLKSNVETSIEKLSNDFHTANVIAMENVERCQNVSDSLTIVTNERLNYLIAFVTKAQSELRNESKQSLISLKSDVETSILKLSNDLHTVNQTTMANVERCNDVSESLTIVTNERFNNLSAFVTSTKSELRNESRQSLILLKSDVETSIKKLSNDFQTVNVTAIKSVGRCNNVSDSLTIMTNERFNNLSAFVTKAQLELRNESKQSLISLKSDVETSILKHFNEIRTINQTTMNILERCNNVSDSLRIATTSALSEMRNETRQSLTSFKSDVNASIQELSNELRTIKTLLNNTIYVESCKSAPKSNGIYYIYYGKSATPLRVYCDQTTDGGGWLVIQRRKDGSVDFERTWADYKTGFGNIENEFWIGNDNIHALTSSGLNELRIDMEDFEGNKAYAKYSKFKVHSENELYRLEVGGYSGDAGDSLTSWHNGMAFSAKDRDNDKWDDVNCSKDRRGAWWYNYYCGWSNLNGHYYHGGNSPYGKGIYWYTWRGRSYSLKTVEMKIR